MTDSFLAFNETSVSVKYFCFLRILIMCYSVNHSFELRALQARKDLFPPGGRHTRISYLFIGRYGVRHVIEDKEWFWAESA